MRTVPEWFFKQSAVIPFREKSGKIEILLITSRKGKRWVIPKGVVEPGVSEGESAAREAFEEAGVEGEISKKRVGKYKYSKWNGVCNVKVFAMRVNKTHELWMEKSFRQRKWVSVSQAADLMQEKKLRKILHDLPRYLKSNMETTHEYHRTPYTISCNPMKLDFEVIHGFLSGSYWSPGVTRETVESAAYRSLCFGLYHEDKQVGYARVITDYTVFAYLADVFVLEEHRGKGLGKWLLECVINHPELQGLRRWMLATRDSHPLYERFGFKKLADPDIFLEIHRPLPALKK